MITSIETKYSTDTLYSVDVFWVEVEDKDGNIDEKIVVSDPKPIYQ